MSRILLIAILITGSAPTNAQDYILTAEGAVGSVGDTTTVSSVHTNNGSLFLASYQWGMCITDPSICDITSVEEGASPSGTPGPQSSGFFSAIAYPGEGYTVACITSCCGQDLLRPGDSNELVVATFSILAEGTSSLEYCSSYLDYCSIGVGVNSMLCFASIGGTVVPHTWIPGSVTGLARTFVRGDVNNSGGFDGLADSLFLLHYGFLGGPTPSCLAAADIDNSGAVDPLTDALFALTAAFLGGPPPSAPFPLCGPDTSPPNLTCNAPLSCP